MDRMSEPAGGADGRWPTLAELLERGAAEAPDRPMAIFAETRITYGALLARSARQA